MHDELELRFYKGRFQISTNTVQDTHSLITGCGNDSFDWDGATARTGFVLTHVAEGPAPATKFKTGSFSLRAHDVEHCVPTDFGAGDGFVHDDLGLQGQLPPREEAQALSH